jgi:hypothetical protein
MAANREIKCVRFDTDDPMNVSMALDELGIRHQCVDAGMGGALPVMTAYYGSAEEALRLVRYLVQRASWSDKIEWQQDRAHREIAGWCELCERANGDECDGGCLVSHRSGKHPDNLFARSARDDAT